MVNTSQRELLLRGLDAIARERGGLPFATEVLVLDNGSRDGSAEAAARAPGVDETIALPERRGKGAERLRAAAPRARALRAAAERGLRAAPGATLALGEALRRATRAAACAGARLLRPDGTAQAVGLALSDAAHGARRRALAAPPASPCRAEGERTREVDWCQSAALLVRREAAAQVDYLDPDFFVYSDEVDFAAAPARRRLAQPVRAAARRRSTTSSCRPMRCPSGGSSRWRATATCTCASTTPPAAARAVRWLTAWTYALRALAALVLPGPLRPALLAPRHRDAVPARGEGLREAAEAYNRG